MYLVLFPTLQISLNNCFSVGMVTRSQRSDAFLYVDDTDRYGINYFI